MKKVEKNNAFWKRMKKELLDKFQTCTKETNFEVEFSKYGTDEIQGLDLFPAKTTTGTFHAVEEIAQFVSYNSLSCWITVATYNGGLCPKIHIS